MSLILDSKNNTRRFPLSFAQTQMWFLDKLEGSSPEYLVSSIIKLVGDLDCSALERSIQALVQYHEPLRTSFIEVDGEPQQEIRDSAVVPFEIHELPDTEKSGVGEYIRAFTQKELAEPFILSEGPLMRVKLLRLNPREHVLFMGFHHIITDGWSMQIILRELTQYYGAFIRNATPDIPPLDLRYSDYVTDQIKSLTGKNLQRLETYWTTKLTGAPPLLTIPTDATRTAESGNEGAILELRLSKELTQQLHLFCREQSATLYMTLLAGFRLLLSRLSGQNDLVIGCPIAGRNEVEWENLIGMFVNTLALRTSLEGNPAFSELVRRERETTLDAYDHQDLPFERIVEKLQPERNLLYSPVFQVFLNLINLRKETLEFPGVRAEILNNPEAHAKFDITLYVHQLDNQVRFRALYKKALFKPDTIQHMLKQLEFILQQAVSNPRMSISEFSLLTKEAEVLLADPTAEIPEPEQIPVTSQIVALAGRNPQASAVSFSGREWSYGELEKTSRKIAAALLHSGAEKETVVAVSGLRSFGLIAAIVGVMRTECVLLILDPEHPSPRQQLMLKESSARFLIRVGENLDMFTDLGDEFENLKAMHLNTGGALLRFPEENDLDSVLLPEPGPDHSAYIFFTSGSTGTPKAVLGHHKGLSQFLEWERNALNIQSTDRVSQLSGFTFDVILRDIFLPLTSGATLCLPDSTVEITSGAVFSWMEKERITIAHTVPSMVQSWLESFSSAIALPALRWLVFVGEPLSSNLIFQWRKSVTSQVEIMNLYGTTETGMAKCYYALPAQPAEGIQTVGKAVPGGQILILGTNNRRCGIGEPGEIVIRSPFSSKGYLKQVNTDRRGFMVNPFTGKSDDKVYFTGDSGVVTSSGDLVVFGRRDDQVKIRGIRIEPGEVVAALSRHPDVESCRVIGVKAPDGEKALVAYLVAPANPSQAELYDFLSLELPRNFIPSSFVILDKLPLTTSGKLDRQALPSPGEFRNSLEVEYTPPRDKIEESLVSLLQELLGIEKVGIKDNFFHLGGNSLMAVRLCYRINKLLGKPLQVVSVFKGPTIKQMADVLRKDSGKSEYVMTLGGQKQGNPVFFLPGISRNALVFRKLAEQLQFGGTCYGLELPLPEEGENQEENFEDLIDHCVNEIRTIQPDGPYTLVGYSFGGLLAYEVARQLYDSSKPVPVVILFDSRHRSEKNYSLPERLSWFGNMFLKEKHIYMRYVIKEVVFRIGRYFGFYNNTERFIPIEVLAGGVFPVKALRYHSKYSPEPFPVDLLVFTVRDTEFSISNGNDLKRWHGYTSGRISFHRIDADYHHQILNEEFLDSICDKMARFTLKQ